jgi:hypothetical protein
MLLERSFEWSNWGLMYRVIVKKSTSWVWNFSKLRIVAGQDASRWAPCKSTETVSQETDKQQHGTDLMSSESFYMRGTVRVPYKRYISTVNRCYCEYVRLLLAVHKLHILLSASVSHPYLRSTATAATTTWWRQVTAKVFRRELFLLRQNVWSWNLYQIRYMRLITRTYWTKMRLRNTKYYGRQTWDRETSKNISKKKKLIFFQESSVYDTPRHSKIQIQFLSLFFLVFRPGLRVLEGVQGIFDIFKRQERSCFLVVCVKYPPRGVDQQHTALDQAFSLEISLNTLTSSRYEIY